MRVIVTEPRQLDPSRSREAQRANMSASFAEQHPDAMRTCYLGDGKGGEFQPGERIYP